MNSSRHFIATGLTLGKPYPMGATWDGEGINFAVFSEDAEEMRLCLFDDKGHNERSFALPGRTNHIFHGYLAGGRVGQLYGFRAQGPYAPEQGLRFNPHKLLLDPYARQWMGEIMPKEADFGYTIGHPMEDLSFDSRDNGETAAKCQVIHSQFDWEGVGRPHTSWSDTVIYEAHVKGLTKLNSKIPESLRGRYLGLCSPPMIEHFQRMGVTALELLPVFSILHDRRLTDLGLCNYWGYGNIGFFRPEHRYASNDAITEFKTMVRELHRAGIEVILDVVYNHTGEGSHLGPTLSFRGLCNRSYYRLNPDRNRYYRDYTGCGNTVNVDHPQVLQWLMDSLRFWVQEMGVDGFRYDLATALARHDSSFLDAIHQDPALKTVKLIAEPWDLGEGGYQAGNFPAGWSEWNDRYRDTLRRFWRGDQGMLSQLAERFTGSADLFGKRRRGPNASINFITCHDGFTLRDLVTYNHKHNQANGEDNRDGSNNNNSNNYGIEGPIPDPALRRLRLQQMKNFLASLVLSVGVPMILGGDEFGQSQQGNNNAYCQDNPISWCDWTETAASQEILLLVQQAAQLRKRFAHFRRHTHLRGEEVCWLHPAGRSMRDEDWHNPDLQCLGMCIYGDSPLLLLINGTAREVRFAVDAKIGRVGEILLDTAAVGESVSKSKLKAEPKHLILAARSLMVREFSIVD